MPDRIAVARELAEIFKLTGHPDRIRLIEELRGGEQDVNTLAQALDLPGARVSQHLSLLRAHRFVAERREGRHHYYHLVQPEIADWIIEGLNFVAVPRDPLDPKAVQSVRKLWQSGGKISSPTSSSHQQTNTE